ncbi:MAG: heavy metal translocating P-type ATPase, partial [Planctomycetota bacterium]
MLRLQPDDVTRLPSADADPATASEVVASADIEVGDVMLVRAGERVAVDGRIIRGASTLDESVVTGESMPVERSTGDPVVAGAMNISGRLLVEATTDGRHTTIARIADLVRDAQMS